jgi:ferric-dicitrate binding protein FerR (iron transport regulator)
MSKRNSQNSQNRNNQNNRKVKAMSPEKRFELLSAYIDNEVTPDEQRLVERWLAEDQGFRNLYQQQLRLGQLFASMPSPTQSSAQTERTIDRFMNNLEQRSRRRGIVWGSIATVAVLMGAIGSAITLNSPTEQLNFAGNQFNETLEGTAKDKQVVDENLIVAMEEPIVPLPKSMSSN